LQSDKVNVTPSNGKFCTLDVKERMTTPPTYLTESELISRMEKHGIGTDASISTHIENIQKRYYVELIPGRKLESPRLYCFVLCYYVFNTKTRRFGYFIWPSLAFI